MRCRTQHGAQVVLGSCHVPDKHDTKLMFYFFAIPYSFEKSCNLLTLNHFTHQLTWITPGLINQLLLRSMNTISKMSHYNLQIHPSTVASTGPVMDVSGMPVNPAHITEVSPSSLFLASLGHTVEVSCLEMEASDVYVASSGETNSELEKDVNVDNPFVEKEMYSTMWVTPGSCRSCSVDTPKRMSELNMNQIKVVQLACNNLTRKQKDLILKHEDHIWKKIHSQGEGTSKGWEWIPETGEMSVSRILTLTLRHRHQC